MLLFPVSERPFFFKVLLHLVSRIKSRGLQGWQQCSSVPVSHCCSIFPLLLATANLSTFSFFSLRCSCWLRLEEGRVPSLPESLALRPDLELDLFLLALQARREIFQSAVECVYMCDTCKCDRKGHKTKVTVAFKCIKRRPQLWQQSFNNQTRQ